MRGLCTAPVPDSSPAGRCGGLVRTDVPLKEDDPAGETTR